MTVKEIRNDLKDIKYYYSRKDKIDKASQIIGANGIYAKVEKYNKAICEAPLRMYDLYIGLYKDNKTIMDLANTISYSFEYVAKLNQKLVKYFEKYFNEKGE